MSTISAIQSYKYSIIASTKECSATSTKMWSKRAKRERKVNLWKKQALQWSPMKSLSLGAKSRIFPSLSQFSTWMSTWTANSSTRCSLSTSLERMTESDLSTFSSDKQTSTGRLRAKFLTFYSTRSAERTKSQSSALTSKDERIKRNITYWLISGPRSTSTLSMHVIGISRIDASSNVIQRTGEQNGSWLSQLSSCQGFKRLEKPYTTCTMILRGGNHLLLQ